MQSLMMRDDQSRSPEERPRPDRPRSDCPVLLSQRLVLRAPHTEDI
ncbi:MAG: N-acetyltransferase, partial [Rhizobium rosettiformans]